MAETTHALITDEDHEAAEEAYGRCRGNPADMLEEIAPRLRARWVAEALEEAAATLAQSPSGVGMAPPRGDLGPEIRYLRALAGRYRDGRR